VQVFIKTGARLKSGILQQHYFHLLICISLFVYGSLPVAGCYYTPVGDCRKLSCLTNVRKRVVAQRTLFTRQVSGC
jgi:hypothetical protein